MKILELGKFYPPHHGGIETLLRSWCEGFVQLGGKVDCVVANDARGAVSETINGVNLHRLASHGTLFSASVCPAYLGSTRRHPADVWHAHFPNPLADIACLRGDSRTPLVISYHSDVVRQAALMALYRPLMHRLLDRAQRIVVATPAHIDNSPVLGPWRGKCEIIPFGINQQRLELTPGIQAAAAALRRPNGDRPILLTIGRLVAYKGHRYLIEAAHALDAAVWIVGTGPLLAELQAQTHALGMADRVRFWGSVADENLPELLHACDIFVLPSITPNEAFGIVQVEAMACGKPVVSCALASGVPFVNQHGVTGLIVPPADAGALAGGLQSLLDDAPLRAKMGAAGRHRARDEFAEAVMVQRYWSLFHKLVHGK